MPSQFDQGPISKPDPKPAWGSKATLLAVAAMSAKRPKCRAHPGGFLSRPPTDSHDRTKPLADSRTATNQSSAKLRTKSAKCGGSETIGLRERIWPAARHPRCGGVRQKLDERCGSLALFGQRRTSRRMRLAEGDVLHFCAELRCPAQPRFIRYRRRRFLPALLTNAAPAGLRRRGARPDQRPLCGGGEPIEQSRSLVRLLAVCSRIRNAMSALLKVASNGSPRCLGPARAF
jgi:hypothetical protein